MDLAQLARAVVASFMRRADIGYRKAMTQQRQPVTYGNVTIDTHARAQARRRLWGSGWRSRMKG